MSSNADFTGSITFGIVFILIGGLVLLNEFDVISLTWSYLLPIILIAAGIAVIVSSRFDTNRQRA